MYIFIYLILICYSQIYNLNFKSGEEEEESFKILF